MPAGVGVGVKGASCKLQAASCKLQAASCKLQAASFRSVQYDKAASGAALSIGALHFPGLLDDLFLPRPGFPMTSR
jgi:hypothetical protein